MFSFFFLSFFFTIIPAKFRSFWLLDNYFPSSVSDLVGSTWLGWFLFDLWSFHFLIMTKAVLTGTLEIMLMPHLLRQSTVRLDLTSWFSFELMRDRMASSSVIAFSWCLGFSCLFLPPFLYVFNPFFLCHYIFSELITWVFTNTW